MTCRINRLVIGEDLVILCISGRITGQDADMLRDLLDQEKSVVAIDLKDVLLVDRKAVKVLARRESNGVELRNCPAYIREWVTRKRADRNAELIAIIDDDESAPTSPRELLESAGFVARCFGSAEEFLEYDLHCEVGCLIAELQMPGMSGLELQARLKEEECNIPIIFITAHENARMRIQAMREGAVEFLAKPFDHQLLLKWVGAALDM